MPKLYIAIALILCVPRLGMTSTRSGTGYDVGNGGIGVFCADKAYPHATLLDVYELHVHGKSVDIRISSPDVFTVTKILTNRLDEKCPQLRPWHQILHDLKLETSFIPSLVVRAGHSGLGVVTSPLPTPGISLNQIGSQPIPSHCQYLTIALQTINPDSNGVSLKINQSLFSELSTHQKAALWIHEAIYYALLKRTDIHPSGRPTLVRSLVQNIIQSDFADRDYSSTPMCTFPN